MRLAQWLRRVTGRHHWHPLEVRRDSRTELSLEYLTFKDLTTSNDELLEIITDIERKLAGDLPFGMTYIRARVVAAATHAYRMITCLDQLSVRRYQELHLVFGALQKQIEAALERSRPAVADPSRLVYDLSELDAGSAEAVGGKSAHAGEIRNRIHLPIPDGFAISTEAFVRFLTHNRLAEQIRALQADTEPGDAAAAADVSREIRQRIRDGQVPRPLQAAILSAYHELSDRLGREPLVSVRSSAVGEDGDMSFAGQYTSVLNVGRDAIADAYKEVVASFYSPQAIFYRGVHGIPDDDLPMGALCMEMVDAVASGVATSRDPIDPAAGRMLIHGGWGLGVGTVSGSVSPDTWTVADTAPHALLASRLGCKDDRVEPAAEGGLATTAVPQEQRDRFCLSEDQVRALADLVVQAASHYRRPQEVEWAVDREGRFVLLQARPLQVSESAQPPGHAAAVDGHRLLLTGTGASRGCGSGPVWRPPADDSLASFPAGAVLVARKSSPRYVEVMDRAAAIVTDIGASTGHMASLAREFGVPTVLDTRSATEVLTDNLVVTVDADGGRVYEGRAERLLEAGPARKADRSVLGTPVHAILAEVARYVVPLTLTDPRSRDFRPQGCRSFHDIARFVHEKSFDVMFQMSDRVTSAQHRATKLNERLPFLLYLIDIGGGVGQVSSPHATREDIRSEPMRALLQGMMHPGLRWWEPRPISVSGFLSVAAETMMGPTDGDHQRRLGDRSYAIVAEAYCNFSSRIGYHFAAVDSHCSDSRSRNYISFRFKGGAADDGRRARRCELIAAILRRLDFQVERNSDLINARLRKYPREEVLARLDQIGRLVVASRQLDMRLGPGAAIDWYADAFFEGNYLFEPPARPKRTGAGSAGPAA